MHLYLVRHGETTLNAARIHQDHTSELSALGRQHAAENGEKLKAYRIDHLLASPYVRTRQTAEIISQAIGLPIEYSDLFREIKRPTTIEGLHTDHPEAVAVKRLIAEKYDDPAYRHSDEETFFHLRDRAVQALAHAADLKHEHLLVVTHAEFMRMLACVALLGEQLTPQLFTLLHPKMDVSHTGLTLLEFGANGVWKLKMWNA